MKASRLIKLGEATLLLSVAVALGVEVAQYDANATMELSAQQRTIAQLRTRVAGLEARSASQPDWRLVASQVEPSVIMVATSDSLGSAWVAHSDAGGSDLVTNFHVVAEAWSSGTARVDVRQDDRTLSGTIVRVDPTNDLAVVHIAQRMKALISAPDRPQLGTTVMAVGSPLGLSGTISVGVVSGFRSLEGSDYMQFSAPISPGNSGGPVVDGHGFVVAIASAKLVGDGVEGLSLAIPIQVACLHLVPCTLAP